MKMLAVDIEKCYQDFSLEIDFKIENEVLVLLGPSGSGKSTILNCISGIVQPDAGKIEIQEEIVFDSNYQKNLSVKKRKTGHVFQSYALFPHLSVEKNIKYGLKNHEDTMTEAEVDELTWKFGLKDLLHKYPHQLSGGESQRTALARSLVIKPNLLLLDEPFTALDCETKEKLYEQFFEIKGEWNIPIVLITHDEDEADYLGDKIIRINNGRRCHEVSPF